jgi:hypothetical protein
MWRIVIRESRSGIAFADEAPARGFETNLWSTIARQCATGVNRDSGI